MTEKPVSNRFLVNKICTRLQGVSFCANGQKAVAASVQETPKATRWHHRNFHEYLATPEENDLMNCMKAVMQPVRNGRPQSILKILESKSRASAFIKMKLKRGHLPTVREVTAAVGLRLSRSRMRLIEALFEKRFICRSKRDLEMMPVG